MTLYATAPIAIVNTTIVDNGQLEDADAVLYLYYSDATAWLRGVTFARNNAPQLVVSYSSAQVYSDTPLDYYASLDTEYVTALPSPGAGADFLSLQDPFFRTATAVRRSALDASPSARRMPSGVVWEHTTLAGRSCRGCLPPVRCITHARPSCQAHLVSTCVSLG